MRSAICLADGAADNPSATEGETDKSGAVIGGRRRLLAIRITEGDSFVNMAASEICPVTRSSQESGRHGESIFTKVVTVGF